VEGARRRRFFLSFHFLKNKIHAMLSFQLFRPPDPGRVGAALRAYPESCRGSRSRRMTNDDSTGVPRATARARPHSRRESVWPPDDGERTLRPSPNAGSRGARERRRVRMRNFSASQSLENSQNRKTISISRRVGGTLRADQEGAGRSIGAAHGPAFSTRANRWRRWWTGSIAIADRRRRGGGESGCEIFRLQSKTAKQSGFRAGWTVPLR
jgi:hypothetical protein